MKKKTGVTALVLFLVFIGTARADELADLLQDLAVQTACLGQYSTAQTGVLVTSRYDDPTDFYDPPMMANRFAAMSGAMTRTITFYGICFDYAQFAWDDIKKYQADYNAAGMKGQQWYIAAADKGDPYTIILYDPVSPEKATTIANGVYLKENSRHKVMTHDLAEGHAWLWVQHKDGTWYWIDPTWTDNCGWPVWGLVENDKEVTYYPDPEYCVSNKYPSPPRPNETQAEKETRSPNSTYAPYVKYTPQYYTGNDFSVGFHAGYISPFVSSNDKFGISLSMDDYVAYNYAIVGSFSVDYVGTLSQPTSFIFGLSAGFQMFSIMTVYAGGGAGFGSGGSDLFTLAWKVNGGLRLQLWRFYTKLDVSYINSLGPAFGIGLGLFL